MSDTNRPNPYSKTQNYSTDPRQSEARALTEAARHLKEAKNDMTNIQTLNQALNYNIRLWTIFQADIASGKNPLPDPIKQSILNLSLFVDKHSMDIIIANNPPPQKLDILIDINRNIAAGLLESFQNEKKQKEKQSSQTAKEKAISDIL